MEPKKYGAIGEKLKIIKKKNVDIVSCSMLCCLHNLNPNNLPLFFTNSIRVINILILHTKKV